MQDKANCGTFNFKHRECACAGTYNHKDLMGYQYGDHFRWSCCFLESFGDELSMMCMQYEYSFFFGMISVTETLWARLTL